MRREDENAQVAEQVQARRRTYTERFGVCPPAATFTLEAAEDHGNAWRFNCGPASLCAVTGLTPEQVRPSLGDFERKGYTDPTLMLATLDRLEQRFARIKPPEWLDYAAGEVCWSFLVAALSNEPTRGLIRVQWGGPWTRPGVPMRARYRHTHWVAFWRSTARMFVFDVNAMCVGGWLPFTEWHGGLVPWLIPQVEPKGDGMFWPTHVLELLSG